MSGGGIRGKDSLLERIGKTFETGDERVEALYLIVLNRRPTNAERERVLKYIAQSKNDTKAAEDLLYSLLMTTEFATNH